MARILCAGTWQPGTIAPAQWGSDPGAGALACPVCGVEFRIEPWDGWRVGVVPIHNAPLAAGSGKEVAS